ncbi:MAG: hypothetical protein ACRDO7_01430 [Nocardioidaceae bacterium]
MITTQTRSREPIAVEFEWLCSNDDSRRLLDRWTRAESALGGIDRLDDIPRALAPHAHADTKDAILLALIRRAQNGDARSASVCILVSLWPKLRSMSGRIQPDGPATLGLSRRDIVCALQSAMFEEILRYRTERWTRKVAGTLALNTLHAVTERRSGRVATSADPITDPESWCAGVNRSAGTRWQDPARRPALQVDWSEPGRHIPVVNLYGHTEASAGPEHDLPEGYPPTRDTEMIQTLAWAVRVAAVSRRDALLLYDLYLGTEPYAAAVRSAARTEGRTPAAIRQRCSRATRAIAAAVRTCDRDVVGYDPAA